LFRREDFEEAFEFCEAACRGLLAQPTARLADR